MAPSRTVVLLALLALLALLCETIVGAVEISSHVLHEAEFAVSELRELSDSGIYRSLSLEKIISAQKIDGVYYNNLALELELRSPHFKSGKPTETFTMIVMNHKTDDISTLAIDEFPAMNEDAIEEFYIDRVEEHRRARDEAFERLRQDAMIDDDAYAAGATRPTEVASSLDGMATDVHAPSSTFSPDGIDELATMSLQELHDVLTGHNAGEDLQRRVRAAIRQRYAGR